MNSIFHENITAQQLLKRYKGLVTYFIFLNILFLAICLISFGLLFIVISDNSLLLPFLILSTIGISVGIAFFNSNKSNRDALSVLSKPVFALGISMYLLALVNSDLKAALFNNISPFETETALSVAKYVIYTSIVSGTLGLIIVALNKYNLQNKSLRSSIGAILFLGIVLIFNPLSRYLEVLMSRYNQYLIQFGTYLLGFLPLVMFQYLLYGAPRNITYVTKTHH